MKDTNLNGKSKDIVAENVERLKGLFPEVFAEESIDFKKLKAVLGEYVDDDEERYNFTWWGKSKALRLAQTPSTGTLRPCPEESKDWDSTQNLYIEGDNLEVLKLLQKTYHNKVKMIYIDPPYNTGEDFVYPDDYKDNIQNYKEITGQLDSDGRSISTNSETRGRYHTNWLNMMYPRLRLARNLLRNDGVIFISIDDNEINNLRKMCDEIFGEKGFIACFIWEKRVTRENRRTISIRHDYILAYVKDTNYLNDGIGLLPMTEEAIGRYRNPDNDERGVWTSVPAIAQAGHGTKNQFYTLRKPNGNYVDSPSGSCWRYTEEKMMEQITDNRIWFGSDGNGVPRIKKFLNEGRQGLTPETMWFSSEVGTNDSAKRHLVTLFDGKAVFETPKPMELIKRMLLLSTSPEDEIVLDFFGGTAPTAHAVLDINSENFGNRKFIVTQLQEPTDLNSEAYKAGHKNISDIGKERIRRAGDKIRAELKEKYDAQQGQMLVADEDKVMNPDELDIGFKVFKLDSSNLKKWNPDEDDLDTSLFDSIENFVEGRYELDVVYEIMLKYGINLTLPIETYAADDKKIYSVGLGALMICLDNEITTDVAQEIVKLKGELSPEVMRVVFKDNGFKDDSAKTNAKEILRTNGVNEIVSI
jgi:adenine-specific DNA-methyltransferase